MNLTRLWIAASLLLSLAACETTHYDYRAPASEQGRMCTVHCAGIRETCRANDISRVQHEKSLCERSNDVTMRSCLSRATNKDQEKECQKNRRSCYVSNDFDRCEENYRQCFVGCGGTIIETKKPLF
jgi:hypothetical protein